MSYRWSVAPASTTTLAHDFQHLFCYISPSTHYSHILTIVTLHNANVLAYHCDQGDSLCTIYSTIKTPHPIIRAPGQKTKLHSNECCSDTSRHNRLLFWRMRYYTSNAPSPHLVWSWCSKGDKPQIPGRKRGSPRQRESIHSPPPSVHESPRLIDFSHACLLVQTHKPPPPPKKKVNAEFRSTILGMGWLMSIPLVCGCACEFYVSPTSSLNPYFRFFPLCIPLTDGRRGEASKISRMAAPEIWSSTSSRSATSALIASEEHKNGDGMGPIRTGGVSSTP